MTRIQILTAALTLLIAACPLAAPIHFAIVSGELETVARLLDEDSTLLELPDSDGSHPLHVAAYYDELEIARLLLKRGADVNATDPDNSSPLHYAAYRGNVDVARLLVENGASLSHRDVGGNTPMLSAARSGSIEMMAYLVEQGGSLDDHTDHGSTLLHLAVVRGHPELTRYLLEQGVDVNRVVDSIRAPLAILRAINFGNAEIARILLEHGADMSYIEPNYGHSFLHRTAIRGDSAMARALLDHGADVNALDKAGKPPLYYAVRYANPTVADLLRSYGAKFDEPEESVNISDMLSGEVKEKDAVVWYLAHSGWAVRTANHFLVFDYFLPPSNPDIPTLANGRIVPEELKDQKVVVFSSHSHSDHYDSYILDWQKAIPNITYVFGHEPKAEIDYTYTAPRTEHTFDGVKVRTIAATDAGVGFLVELDGLVIFHAGDHASGKVELHPEYTDEIDYLADINVPIDIAFMPVTGCSLGTPESVREGVAYALMKLNPKVYFPQHAMDSEYLFISHADFVRERGYHGLIGLTENSGDHFEYRSQHLQ